MRFPLWTACSLVTPIGAVPPLKPDPNIVRGREQNNVKRNRLASKQHLIEDYVRHLDIVSRTYHRWDGCR
jgi:hypothetical protein